ncbi:MAG TPA: cytochrome C oxidase subunit IV family protein [Tepidisphaeraceae bacterium]|jgi:cytochrome c oxidase subunit 4
MTESTPSVFRQQVTGVQALGATPAGADHEEHGHAPHAVSPLILVGVFAVLMVLTGITVMARYADFGYTANLAIAIGIAVVKAVLVVAYFMHLRYDNLFYTAIVVLSIIFIGVFILTVCLDSDQYNPILAPANVQAATS